MVIAELLKGCALFRGFSDAGLEALGRITCMRKFPAGAPIFVENMVAEGLFIVSSGVVQIAIRAPDGREQVLDQLAPGDTFGELSLINRGRRLVTATAQTDCELLELQRREFAKFQKQKPQASLKLMINVVNQFGRRAQAASEHLKTLVTTQLPG